MAPSSGIDGEGAASGRSSSPGGGDNPAALVEQLRADRLWLLQQLDAGRWSELRLDLAALERELGQLLEQAQSRWPQA
jgi:hypothetical protein